MVIAVNTRFLIKDKLEGFGYFTKEVFSLLARAHPEHQFYFLFDRPFEKEFIFSGNVHGLVVSPAARHPFLWKYWFDIRIPSILKKIRADVFVSPDGYASLYSRVPQCLVVHDLGFLHYPEAYKKTHSFFLKRYVPEYIKKAGSIATVSRFSKEDMINHYPVDPGKIDVVYNAPKDIFRPLPYDQQEPVKQRFTGGTEYFIYVGAIQPRKNLVHLLKAFSIFKKRQKSNMKLVLAGRMAWKNEEFSGLLKTYRYREEVILTGYVEEHELVQLVASAYALIYPSFFEGFGVPVLEGMRSDVPVLTSGNSSMQEIGEDAALYFDPSDYHDIADKMMMIYKDEDLRKKLIGKGRTISAGYTWERTAELMWQCILKAIP